MKFSDTNDLACWTKMSSSSSGNIIFHMAPLTQELLLGFKWEIWSHIHTAQIWHPLTILVSEIEVSVIQHTVLFRQSCENIRCDLVEWIWKYQAGFNKLVLHLVKYLNRRGQYCRNVIETNCLYFLSYFLSIVNGYFLYN